MCSVSGMENTLKGYHPKILFQTCVGYFFLLCDTERESFSMQLQTMEIGTPRLKKLHKDTIKGFHMNFVLCLNVLLC